MADFVAEVFQNEYLPAGETDVHAIVSVRCSNAGMAGQSTGEQAGEIIVVDTSGSMGYPMNKIYAARDAATVALNEIVDGTWFAVIAGNDQAHLIYPNDGGPVLMHQMNAQTRAAAHNAVRMLGPAGGTAIGRWLTLAKKVFDTAPATQRHAILLTDGRDESERPDELRAAVANVRDTFQCDCRGVGADWVVNELRFVATELLGTVGLIADPAQMAADFEAIMRNAMSRGVAHVNLQVWTPQGAELIFVKQVAPTIEDLTNRRTPVGPLVGEYPTGSWGDEEREYHVAVRLPAKMIGNEQLAARLKLVIGGQTVSQGLVKAIWSDDDALTTRINPAVAHYTGQAELADAIQEGLAAKAAGDEETATVKLGRAVQLAAATGNEEVTTRLKKVVTVDDADTGTVRLRRDIGKLDEMALDTASTKTTRVR